MTRLRNKHETAMLRVLDSWPGTPEELGAILQVSTSTPFGLTPETRRADNERRATARRQLFECDGGYELYELEMRMLRGY